MTASVLLPRPVAAETEAALAGPFPLLIDGRFEDALDGRRGTSFVSVNCHGAVAANIPFGGYRQSGWGREFGREGMYLYLETKAVTVKL